MKRSGFPRWGRSVLWLEKGVTGNDIEITKHCCFFWFMLFFRTPSGFPNILNVYSLAEKKNPRDVFPPRAHFWWFQERGKGNRKKNGAISSRKVREKLGFLSREMFSDGRSWKKSTVDHYNIESPSQGRAQCCDEDFKGCPYLYI